MTPIPSVFFSFLFFPFFSFSSWFCLVDFLFLLWTNRNLTWEIPWCQWLPCVCFHCYWDLHWPIWGDLSVFGWLWAYKGASENWFDFFFFSFFFFSFWSFLGVSSFFCQLDWTSSRFEQADCSSWLGRENQRSPCQPQPHHLIASLVLEPRYPECLWKSFGFWQYFHRCWVDQRQQSLKDSQVTSLLPFHSFLFLFLILESPK